MLLLNSEKKNLLVARGGHSMAAGLTVEEKKLGGLQTFLNKNLRPSSNSCVTNIKYIELIFYLLIFCGDFIKYLMKNTVRQFNLFFSLKSLGPCGR